LIVFVTIHVSIKRQLLTDNKDILEIINNKIYVLEVFLEKLFGMF